MTRRSNMKITTTYRGNENNGDSDGEEGYRCRDDGKIDDRKDNDNNHVGGGSA